MIFRRIRDHAAQQNWFGAAMDFAIVVIGVFVGIEASNWNEARADRQQARLYRFMLLSDVEANLQNLAVRRQYYQRVREEALVALSELNQSAASLDDQFLVHAYQATQILPWALKRNAYDEIVSVGAMASLGDPNLRDQIANYYVGSEITGANISTVPPYREIVRRVMPYEVQRAIRTHCNERFVRTERRAIAVVLPKGPCRLGLDDASVRRAVRQVHQWPGLSLDLNRQLVDLDQKLQSIATVSDRALELRAALIKANS